MATLSQWFAGARPRTLPAAVAPVLVGTAAAAQESSESYGLGLLAAVVAVALQVGVNYANDYSDGIRGTDDGRVGPVRLVGGRLAGAENVKLAAFFSFGVSAVAGLALVALSAQWILLIVGALAIVAAWRYTGGTKPYGYAGLGEVSVFVFFGLVATVGTELTQAGSVTPFGLVGAIGVGAIASALLVINNLRDIPGDTKAGKRTLAVRLGDRRTATLWCELIAISAICAVGLAWWQPWAALALLALALVWRSLKVVRGGAQGTALIPVLGVTGTYELGYAALILIGVLLGR